MAQINVSHIYAKIRKVDDLLAEAWRAKGREQTESLIWEARRHLSDVAPLVAHVTEPPEPFACPDPHQAAEEATILLSDQKSGRVFRPH